MNNRLFISNNLDEAEKEILRRYDNVIVFDIKELKIDDVHKIKEEAYKGTEKVKYLLIKSEKINVVSQNAMLKLLEEPPHNVYFILLTTSKYGLFDTIKSRLILENLEYKSDLQTLDLDVNNLTNESILNFIQNNKKISKDEAKQILYLIFDKLETTNEKILNSLEKSVKLLNGNTNIEICLSYLLLTIKVCK